MCQLNRNLSNPRFADTVYGEHYLLIYSEKLINNPKVFK